MEHWTRRARRARQDFQVFILPRSELQLVRRVGTSIPGHLSVRARLGRDSALHLEMTRVDLTEVGSFKATELGNNTQELQVCGDRAPGFA
jgi:hypothetical protein